MPNPDASPSIWTALAGLPFAQNFYDVGGIRTRALEAGQGEPLILLHGTGGHADGYLRAMAALAQRFHVYALDMVAHGYTDTIDGEPGIEAFKSHLAAFVELVAPGPVLLSGESLGAIVASWYAIENPQRVRKLVLNTGIPMPLDGAGKLQVKDGLERSRKAAAGLTREAVASRLAWLMRDPERSVTPELVDLRWGIYTQPGRPAAMARVAETVMGALMSGAWDRSWLDSEAMQGIRCPTLVLWTSHNPGQSAERAALAARHIPDHRMVILENSAHWPQWEEPAEFVRHHIEFLEG
jgi:2-hydroxy-6-oxonona-2,4-dienedioate hydrolase